MRTISLFLVFIITISWQLDAAEEGTQGLAVVENVALPSTMRVGRYLAAEQRLFDAYCGVGGDTLVLTWEVRASEEEWTAVIYYGNSTHVEGREISIVHERTAGYPQFRRLIIVVPPGTEAQSASMTMRSPHFEAHSSEVTNYTTLDVK